jgi:hypothetical protein
VDGATTGNGPCARMIGVQAPGRGRNAHVSPAGRVRRTVDQGFDGRRLQFDDPFEVGGRAVDALNYQLGNRLLIFPV